MHDQRRSCINRAELRTQAPETISPCAILDTINSPPCKLDGAAAASSLAEWPGYIILVSQAKPEFEQAIFRRNKCSSKYFSGFRIQGRPPVLISRTLHPDFLLREYLCLPVAITQFGIFSPRTPWFLDDLRAAPHSSGKSFLNSEAEIAVNKNTTDLMTVLLVAILYIKRKGTQCNRCRYNRDRFGQHA